MLSHSHRLKEIILPIPNALHNFTHRLDLSDAGAVLKRPLGFVFVPYLECRPILLLEYIDLSLDF